ncbi:MAG: hypothetical protein Q8S73_04790 [Deltaproteobacteria bacterium]|nr:hypothetical protein [Myxococcales bacterium]MDP3213395.1 hypothetical protein [Deltaproteobacteria bacterium]
MPVFRQNARDGYAQRFADERRLAAVHNRFRTGMLTYLGLCALLAGALCAYLSWEGLARNVAAQRACDRQVYPWQWRADDSPPYASREACVAARPLLRGEAREFALLAAPALTLGLLLMALGLGLRHRLPPAMLALRDAPESVVWTYGTVYVALGSRRPMERVVTVCTRDGAAHTLRVADVASLERVLDRITSHCPQAAMGYTPALAASFEADRGARPHDPAGAPGAKWIEVEVARRR